MEQETIHITAADLSFLEKELSKTETPVTQSELVEKMAFKKAASQLSLEAKKYDPECVFQVGDLVYKEYDEPLTVSSKGAEQFQGSVVLKVINKIALPDFNCEMLEVDYTGGGIFRKHIDYMKKTNTQVLLPSNSGGKAKKPAILKKEEDPRLTELPMTDKDLKKLERNLKSALLKSDKFFNWNGYWQLEEKRIKFKDKDIKGFAQHFQKTQQSTATTELIAKFFKVKQDDQSFDLYCLSLNYILEKDYKKTFVYVSPDNWGRWFSKESLDSFLSNLPITKPKAKMPALEETEGERLSAPIEMPLKVYLTWREVLSGCIKIPKSMNKHFSQSREYTFTDTDDQKDYTVYYYPSSHVFFGLKEFYDKNNVPQGASLTLEKTNPTHCSFSLKKSKKKLEVPILTYNPAKDKIEDSGEDAFTFSLPNKIIFLERETLASLFDLYKERNSADLKDLLILIFKNFGLEGEALSIHYLRAFHLVDVIKHTAIEDVEKVLLNAPDFSQSEKGKGIFTYQEEEEGPEEITLEELAQQPVDREIAARGGETESEILPEIGTVGEIAEPEGSEIIEVVEPEFDTKKEEPAKEVPAKTPKVKRAPPAKPAHRKKEIIEKPVEEKAPKKKKERIKIEQERAPRRRRGEKRFIEERIEQEESELEALFAKKAKEEEGIAPPVEELKPAKETEAPAPEKKEDYQEYVSESPLSSIFADKLKSALEKKKPETPETDKKKKKKKKK